MVMLWPVARNDCADRISRGPSRSPIQSDAIRFTSVFAFFRFLPLSSAFFRFLPLSSAFSGWRHARGEHNPGKQFASSALVDARRSASFPEVPITIRRWLRKKRNQYFWRWCQTNSNSSQLGQGRRPLPRTETAPLGESGGAVLLEEGSAGEAAFLIEVVRDRSVDGGEFLKTSHPPEPEHRPLPSSERQMRILCPVVQPATRLLPICHTKVLHGRAVGAQLIRHVAIARTMPAHRFLEEFQCGLFISCLRHEALEDFSLMIDGAP